MLGILYIILAWIGGYVFLKRFLPSLFDFRKSSSLIGSKTFTSSWMVTVPASFLVGILFATWLTYMASFFLKSLPNPLLAGNIISFSVLVLFIACYFIKNGGFKYETYLNKINSNKRKLFLSSNKIEIVYVLFFLIIWTFLMCKSFYIKNGIMNIGESVASDFAPHLAVIRSFSFGSNFPTEYPHFADGSIRYHFMFQFLAGNLEFLGMRLDWAFNLPSILSIVSFIMLLYSFTLLVFGDKRIGVLTGVLFFFRSSFAFFTYISQKFFFTEILGELDQITTNIGNTPKEEWGLYAQKVYLNQRHLSFALGIMMIVLIAVLPLFIKMVTKEEEIDRPVGGNETRAGRRKGGFYKHYLSEFIASKDAWIPDDAVAPIVLGIILGLTSFWNGAVVIAAISILFVMAIFSKQRLAYLNIALFTIILAYFQSKFFIRGGGSPVSPSLYVGFLADTNGLEKDLSEYFFANGFLATIQHFIRIIPHIISFYIEVLGTLPFMIYIYLFLRKGGSGKGKKIFFIVSTAFIGCFFTVYKLLNDDKIANKNLFIASMLFVFLLVISFGFLQMLYNDRRASRGSGRLILAFTAPIILASTIKLTIDVDINHKYIVIASILLNIFVAALLVKVSRIKKPAITIIGVLISTIIVITGIVDLITLFNLSEIRYQVDCNNAILVEVKNTTGKNEIFLTDDYSIHPILLAGRKVFCGWPYYTWSAGYDTDAREEIRQRIFNAVDEQTLKKLVGDNNISYIVIDEWVRDPEKYVLDEELIRRTFGTFYEYGELIIYKTY
ncbi:MAG: hypothetical protein GX992_01240 [Clostridium sp.]|nr:hypothetical protein [Clostridium sp.]